MNIEFSDEEIRMIAIALTVSGLISCGERPQARVMEELILKRNKFHDITLKTIAFLERK